MEAPAPPVERTFAFVDLAGFTALTEVHGDPSAVGLLERFVALAEEAVAGRGQVVKSIGDAVMLAFVEPRDALDATRTLVLGCRDEPAFPVLRAGMHHGEALARAGDWFGSTVNLTARVAGQSHGGQTLATVVIAAAARDRGINVVELGQFRLRNVGEPVELFDVELAPPAECLSIDPVCRMVVVHETAAGRLRYLGRDHWFCSLGCVGRFAGAPDDFVVPGPAPSCPEMFDNT